MFSDRDSGAPEYVIKMARHRPPGRAPHARACATGHGSAVRELPTLDEMYGQNTGRKPSRAPPATVHIPMIYRLAAKR